MWDLLCFLRSTIWLLRHARQMVTRVRFLASVVNDNRESGEEMNDEDYRPTDFWLVAHAVIDGAGSPCLVVTLPHEECLV
ncbi:MAG: hypothetical protein HYX68_00875 [Planctomycetes bacterium]|nr:hypothetical protein [Planctomycetota bacterium]